MTRVDWFIVLGAVVAALGSVRLLLSVDIVRRIVALNIAGAGVFIILIALAARTDPPDPVLHALVLTGIVIAVSVTGLALILLRHGGTESDEHETSEDDA